MKRHITLWRKPDAPLDHDFHVSESECEAESVAKNLRARGVKNFQTYELGAQVAVLSKDWNDQ